MSHVCGAQVTAMIPPGWYNKACATVWKQLSHNLYQDSYNLDSDNVISVAHMTAYDHMNKADTCDAAMRHQHHQQHA